MIAVAGAVMISEALRTRNLLGIPGLAGHRGHKGADRLGDVSPGAGRREMTPISHAAIHWLRTVSLTARAPRKRPARVLSPGTFQNFPVILPS